MVDVGYLTLRIYSVRCSAIVKRLWCARLLLGVVDVQAKAEAEAKAKAEAEAKAKAEAEAKAKVCFIMRVRVVLRGATYLCVSMYCAVVLCVCECV